MRGLIVLRLRVGEERKGFSSCGGEGEFSLGILSNELRVLLVLREKGLLEIFF